MPISNSLALPDTLSNGTTADASQVMADFNYLLAALNRALLDQGGGSGMNAQNTQIKNLAAGTDPNDAVTLGQIPILTNCLPLAGGTLTGPLNGTSLSMSGNGSFGGTLSVTGAASFGATLSVTGAVTMNGGITATGTLTTGSNVNSIGYLGVPSHSVGGGYTLVLSDMGKSIDIVSTGGVTIPSNASVAFPVGTVIQICALAGPSQNIFISSDTLTLAGTSTTGTRSLAFNGQATIRKTGTTNWLIWGSGLS